MTPTEWFNNKYGNPENLENDSKLPYTTVGQTKKTNLEIHITETGQLVYRITQK